MADQESIERDGLNVMIKNFLVELKNDAHRKGSKMEFVYSNALKSLKAHQEKIRSVQECIKLKYIGDKTCLVLRKKLEDYCKKNSIVLPPGAIDTPENEENQAINMEINAVDQTEPSSSQQAAQKRQQKSKRPYVPKYKSAGFAIMIALYRLEQDESNYSVSKIDLSKQAERYFGETNNGDSSQMSNMWSAMKTLVERGLVSVEKSRCNYYTLTDLGRELSTKMYSAMAEKLNLPGETAANDEEQDEDVEEACLNERLVYLPGTYEIVLIIDSREQYSGVTLENKKTKLVSDLQSMGTNCEMRTLPVGDFAWIVKPNTAKRELVLDFLIERKRTDDLIASIRDQRWNEQKVCFHAFSLPDLI